MQSRDSSRLEWLVIALPWAALPALAMHLIFVWDRLPQWIATHFDVQGHPNGWESPSGLAISSLAALTLELAILTPLMIRAFRLRSLWRALTIINYVACGGLFILFWQLADHAAFGRPLSAVWPLPLIIPLAGLLVAALALAHIRFGAEITPDANALLIAEETHRSLLLLVFSAPGIGIGAWLALTTTHELRFIGILLLAIMVWVAVAVLEGFRYLIRSDGVQIKGFLLSLRFIPRSMIRGYRRDHWSGLGYGVRLYPTGTAYIWGGRDVVSIATDSGEVMLGHKHPERLIQDLDRMMQAR